MSEHRGRYVKAARDFARGEVIFVERPLWSFRKLSAEEDRKIVVYNSRLSKHVHHAWEEFQRLPEEKKQKILDLYFDNDHSLYHQILYVLAIEVCRHGFKISLEDAVKMPGIIMRLVMNASELERIDETDGSKYFEGILHENFSRMAHSCAPNCNWDTDADGIRYIIASKPIQAGDELFISYCGFPFDQQPIWLRRERLRSTWNFECDCSRCSASYDSVRGFACENPKCHGFIYVKQRDLSQTPTMTECSSCRIRCSQAYENLCFAEEKSLMEEYQRLRETKSDDWSERAQRLFFGPKYRQHWIRYKFIRTVITAFRAAEEEKFDRGSLYAWITEFSIRGKVFDSAASLFMGRWLAYMGYELMREKNFRRHVEALHYYRAGLDHMRDACGGEQANLAHWREEVEGFRTKFQKEFDCFLGSDLLVAVKRLEEAKTGAFCDACGINSSHTVKLSRCSNCLKVWYCSRECQSVDWRNCHKPFCKRQ